MNPFLSFIRLLSDPTIAFLLFSIGSAGLLAELYNPNFVTGILGGAGADPRVHRPRARCRSTSAACS